MPSIEASTVEWLRSFRPFPIRVLRLPSCAVGGDLRSDGPATWRWLMSVTSLVSLNGGLGSQQSTQQTQISSTGGAGATSLHPATSAPTSTSALSQDQFTPSSQTES